jgi:hypothetical protein
MNQETAAKDESSSSPSSQQDNRMTATTQAFVQPPTTPATGGTPPATHPPNENEDVETTAIDDVDEISRLKQQLRHQKEQLAIQNQVIQKQAQQITQLHTAVATKEQERLSLLLQVQQLQSTTSTTQNTGSSTKKRKHKEIEPHCLPKKTKRTEKSETLFQARIQELLAYKAQQGHYHVSRHENKSLWGWMKSTRQKYQRTMQYYVQQLEQSSSSASQSPTATKGKGKVAAAAATTISGGSNSSNSRLLPAHHLAQLQAIGFPWSVKVPTYDASWEHMFEELLRYKAEHNGSTHVPRPKNNNQNDPSSNKYAKLNLWVKGKVSKERDNDFVWVVVN